MNNPLRLLESSPNSKTRELLRAARRERPPARAAERAATTLGVASLLSAAKAVAAAGVATASGAGAASLSGLGSWLVAGLVSGTTVVGGAALVQRELGAGDARQATSLAAGRSVAAPGGAAKRVAAAERSEPAGDRAAVGEVAQLGNGGTARSKVAAGVPHRSPPKNSGNEPALLATEGKAKLGGALAREAERIDAARSLLASGAPESALVELAAYEKVRETGTLDREALLVRIDALQRLGKGSQAKALARQYLARFPKDTHEARLRRLAGDDQ